MACASGVSADGGVVVSTRGRILTLGVGERLVTETCYACGVLFAMVEDFYDHRLQDKKNFYCPNGHGQAYIHGKSDAQKLRDAEAREVALRDQLDASIRDTEAARSALLRDRSRIAKGVCPCCNRSFENVRRHMESKHPDYAAPKPASRIKYECGCGRRFESYAGLRIHQGRSRSKDWAKPGVSVFRSHLTVGATR